MKTSGHFDDDVSKRPDRVDITDEMRERALREPEYVEHQQDGRTKRWIYVAEQGKWLRVVALPDGETVLTNMWDRGFEEKLKRYEQGHEWRMVRWTKDED
jgi:hypothetical protein